MEKRQAVEFLEYLRQDRNLERTIYGDALNMAIEALKAQLSQEGATSDLISRQAARHALCKAVHKGEDVPCENQTASCLWTGTRVCDFVREIDALPTIQPEPQWIPVSERLPEVGQMIIAQCRANIIKTLKLDSDGDWYQDAEHCYMSGFVVAWMPLPEAYKPNKK